MSHNRVVEVVIPTVLAAIEKGDLRPLHRAEEAQNDDDDAIAFADAYFSDDSRNFDRDER